MPFAVWHTSKDLRKSAVLSATETSTPPVRVCNWTPSQSLHGSRRGFHKFIGIRRMDQFKNTLAKTLIGTIETCLQEQTLDRRRNTGVDILKVVKWCCVSRDSAAAKRSHRTRPVVCVCGEKESVHQTARSQNAKELVTRCPSRGYGFRCTKVKQVSKDDLME